MQICMKLDSVAREKLHEQLAAAQVASGLNYSEIGDLCDVHPSQVSRICRGDFKTLSHNVMQICGALGVDAPGSAQSQGADPTAHKLTESVFAMWDRTPADAERIVRLLDRLREFRSAAG